MKQPGRRHCLLSTLHYDEKWSVWCIGVRNWSSPHRARLWREERSLVCGQIKSALPDRRNSICLPFYRSTMSRWSCTFLSARSEVADSRAPVTDVAQTSHLNLKPSTCTAQNTQPTAPLLYFPRWVWYNICLNIILMAVYVRNCEMAEQSGTRTTRAAKFMTTFWRSLNDGLQGKLQLLMRSQLIVNN